MVTFTHNTPQSLQAISGPPQPPVESAGVSHLKKPTAGKKTPQSSPPRAARSSGSSKESPLLDSYEGKGSRRKSLDPSSAAGKRKGTSSGHASPEPSPVSTLLIIITSLNCVRDVVEYY